MIIESLPSFTPQARQRWETIPAEIRQRLLSNVWCGHCRRETAITNFSGTMRDLIRRDMERRERQHVPGDPSGLGQQSRPST